MSRGKLTSLQTLNMSGTKWEFFVAAIDLFAAKGYANVAIHEIAATLDMKAAGMYNYFSSKDELLGQIYDFFTVNFEALLPDMREILNSIPNTPPHEVLAQLKVLAAHDPYYLMKKIMHIILEERNRDLRARELSNRIFTVVPRHYVKTVLLKMVELKVIKPLDIDPIVTLFLGLDLYALYAYGSEFALGNSHWETCHKFLFSFIEPTQPPDEQLG